MIEVTTFVELIQLTSLFYKLDFEEDLNRKTLIELRPNIPGFYKGIIYCTDVAQAQKVKYFLNKVLRDTFNETVNLNIIRGCLEYSEKYPEFEKVDQRPEEMMSFPDGWKKFEEQFDQYKLAKSTDFVKSARLEFCLSDFYIIQKWIDYGKGIGDHTKCL